MSDKFKKDLNNIKLNDNLKNKTMDMIKQTLDKEQTSRNLFSLRKSFVFAFTSFVLILLIIGITVIKGPFNNSVKAKDLMQGVSFENITLKENLSKEFLDSTSEFSISMFKELSKEKNAVYSPLSLCLSLGTILNGSDGKSNDEILRTLSKYGVSEADLNIYYKTLTSRLMKSSKNSILNISNSIWYDDELNINNDFLKINKTYYETSAYKLDLQSDNAPNSINAWISKVTNKKIDTMIDTIDKNAVMLMFSTLYFNDTWKFPFTEPTHKANFTTSDKKTINAEFMSTEINIKNISTEAEQIISLPYKEGNLSFIAMMPNDNINIRDYISKLDKDTLATKINSLQVSDTHVILPKFQIGYKKSLNKDLSSLGINTIFDEKKANLLKMGSTKGNIFVKDITQKNYITVGEKGTEASSATKSEEISKGISTAKVINFNHPFLYLIIDDTTNLPILMGVVDTPIQK
ncbi:serpin family protein [Clostridium folliculivorans]|uniref:Serine proteinase inhibitor n=1 Tax=Clostridium folliculivorans TaxID=2886038 RepID=A0A9W6DAM0_9CLOT|nr:serpin family protein [Clostridium folliculivorans]GKU25364.1 serine proteinase inhibitor [Clostridium folliculivorans]GKU28385.1 serine proteinase inhibitor [Clostridium folliculivorans]